MDCTFIIDNANNIN